MIMKGSSWRRVLLGIVLLCLGTFDATSSQETTTTEQQVNMQGEIPAEEKSPYALLATKLQSNMPELPDQEAVDIAAVLHTAKSDAETTWLLKTMKEGSGKEHFLDFANEASPRQVVQALQEATKQLQMMEVLFRDPQRAVQELLEEGMIPPDKISIYQNDPALLEDDYRKNIYFMIVSYAAAGGYL